MHKIETELKKLKKIAQKGLDSQDFETACEAVETAGYISYLWNQFYTDDELESQIRQLSEMAAKENEVCKGTRKESVLFYDGFGLDSRGLALNYLKALLDSGYKVIYLTVSSAQAKQPVLEKALEDYIRKNKMIIRYFSEDWPAAEKIQFFNETVCQYRPASVFFYSLPYDVAGIIFMELLEGKLTRFLINLTDHAFWLGKTCADYYIDFRTYGTSISKNQRNIPVEKIRLLPYYPFINEFVSYSGLPFDLKDKKLIFSGGALYKTLGDEENRYYKSVDYILSNYEDAVFYYVGNGDRSELEKIQQKYPDRVYYSEERKDFFHIFEDTYFYLNTFPLVGGLMMQYAAMSEVLPLTLRHGNDGDGILSNQRNLGIEFDDLPSLEAEIDRLMTDQEYKKSKESVLKQAVPSPEKFRENLVRLMELKPTEYLPDFEKIDTSDFLEGYRQRIQTDSAINQALVRKSNRNLIRYYPGRFASEVMKRKLGKLSGK